MRKCNKCGCLCDNADLVNGLCDICREDAQQESVNWGIPREPLYIRQRKAALEMEAKYG